MNYKGVCQVKKEFKNPKKTRKWLGGSFFLIAWFFGFSVVFLLYMLQKKMDGAVSECSLADPSFSRIFGCF